MPSKYGTTCLAILSRMVTGSSLSAIALLAAGVLALAITGGLMMSGGAVEEELANDTNPKVMNNDTTPKGLNVHRIR
jgi:hypothetical protein